MSIILGYILTFLYVFIVIGFSSIIQKKFSHNLEITRKIIHIFVSFAWVIMYFTIANTFHLIIIPFIFIILNYFSYKYKIIKSMEREKNQSLGTVYYPISMTIMATFSYFNEKLLPYYGMSLFVMAFADGLAPIFAQKFKSIKLFNTSKTLIGSLTIFIISFLVIVTFNIIFSLDLKVSIIILICLINTIVELFSKKGLDNITLPLVMFITMYLLMNI